MLFGKDPRIGKYRILVEIIEGDTSIMSDLIFKGCVVIGAEYLMYEKALEYMFWSPDIELVVQGQRVPRYDCEITNIFDDDDNLTDRTIKWVMV